tara:strand:+ start:1198 stop:3330 length:2133 start_codon:yes stop_codon:yes gene_type:complete
MADDRTNIDIFSGIGFDDEPIVSQEEINNLPDFPTENLNAELLNQSVPYQATETQVDVTNVDKQKFRTAMGGLTFQFWDEMEAYATSLVNDGVSYDQAKTEINKKVALYQKAHPKEAFSMELAGAAIPTLLSVFGTPAAMSASFANIFRIGRSVFKSGTQSSKLSVGTRMNRAGLGGGVYSLGESDDKGFMDFVGGYAMGAPIAGGFVLGGNVLSGISTYVSTLAKSKFGDKTSKAVRKELNRLMEQTGKSEDQVIVDLMNGQLLSENQTLVNLIKTTIQGKGKAQEVLDEIAKKRIGETKTNVIDDLQNLATNTKSDASLTRIWKADQATIKKKEKQLYDTVFGKKGGNQNLVKGNDDGLVDDILKAAQMKGSGVFEELETIYSTSGHLVPLFTKNKNGVIRMLRQPNLEDVEVVRRTLAERAYEFNKSGKGQSGGNLQTLEGLIRGKLDNMSPGLTAVRERASQVRRARESYEYGLGLLTGKKGNAPEDVEEFMRDFGDVPGVMNALRIGVIQALKNKEGSAAIKKMADPDSNLYTIIRKIIPEDKLDDITKTIDVGANAAKVNPQLQGNFGSQTQPLIETSRIAGAAGNRDGGLIVAVADMAFQYIRRNMGLSPQQADEFVKVITARPENKQLLEQALADNNMGAFTKLLDSMITGVAGTAGDLRAKTGSSDINTTLDPINASGISGLMSLVGQNAVPLLTGYPQEQ